MKRLYQLFRPYFFILPLSCLTIFSCKKNLDVKPNQALLIPTSLQDFQALIDVGLGSGGSLGETSADNYYILDTRFNALSSDKQAVYIWGKDMFPGSTNVTDWSSPYNRILTANAILEGLQKIDRNDNNAVVYDNVAGSAYFVRALAYYNLAQVFCKTYDSATAKVDMGLPIKLSSDVNDLEGRSTVQQLYDRILEDGMSAEKLLPSISQYKTRPSGSAAAALLARVYLVTRQYGKALEQANISLSSYNTLLDYNTLNASAADPIAQYGAEVLFNEIAAYGGTNSVTFSGNFFVDTMLYRSYDVNDLRKTIFFKVETTGLVSYKGSYSGMTSLAWFTGLATDEMYLTRAECSARLGDKNAALDDLNFLLSKRYKSNSFTKITANTSEDALEAILRERRKELVFRSIRWMDIRRLNKEPKFVMTLIRRVNGQTFSLLPNSDQYVLPIPGSEILYNPIPQNPR